jgi:hypothetical protein
MGALGTAVHAALEAHVTGEEPDLQELVARHHVDPDELERLYAYGRIAWSEIRGGLEGIETELVVEGRGIRGHIDVAAHDGVTASVVDWKTNRVQRHYWPQVVGYAAALVHTRGMPISGEVRVGLVWVRHFSVEWRTVTGDDIEALYRDIDEAQASIGTRYAPGEPCTYCPRQTECEARTQFIRDSAMALAPMAEEAVASPTLAGLYSRAKLLKAALDRYQTALKLALADGPQPDGEGNMLHLEETTLDRIDTWGAWPILLQEGFSDDEILKVASLSKGKLLDIAGAKAAKGYKGKVKARILAALNEAGAVRKIEQQRISVRKGENDE